MHRLVARLGSSRTTRPRASAAPQAKPSGRPRTPEHPCERTAPVFAAEGTREVARTRSPEARQVLDPTSGGSLSVAERAAHTHLPPGLVRILVAQLTESGLITVRKPIPHAERADRELLTTVLDGLEARFGA
ncbi:DUF742 domain-containing protein [Streptomyces sp. NPDC001288]|uniref:DUF742 domain-containing protein n=1 Tax=unclassified Streptomyces TaxID=2593676 RepID=UPI00332C6B0A